MPSVAYYTASAPFWDFIERLESYTDNTPEQRRERCQRRRDRSAPGEGAERSEGEGESRRGRCGRRGPGHRGPWGHGHPHGPPHHGPGPHGHHGPGHHGPGPHGPEAGPGPFPHRHGQGWGRRGPWGAFGFPWAGAPWNNDNQDSDFKPAVDLFTATEAYTLHVSLPGAKREDIGVSYEPAKSELVISGVVHRSGDEEFLKSLSGGFRERDSQTGPFERRVRFGNRRWAADVNEEAIAAKLEDGVLTVVIPRIQRNSGDEKRSIPVDVDEETETAAAEKEALSEAEQHKANEMEVETETVRGDEDVDGDTLYSQDEKRKSVTFEDDEDDFVDVKRVDIQ